MTIELSTNSFGETSEVLEDVRTRRSARKFKRLSVPGEVVAKILYVAMLSSSGGNRRPWRFVHVEDP